YVGKASGTNGIWQRWSDYMADGHGGDVDLEKLIKKNGIDYISNYVFTLLEIVSGMAEEAIDERESYWKRVMLSRIDGFGHNKN
ncbi:MAG: GIY-YIG nuclease family protein, partial [Clostridia bacterium]|nr:GIY-YIG nuclease family protein [Clostridia bacterium]